MKQNCLFVRLSLALAAISLALVSPALRADTYLDNLAQSFASNTSITSSWYGVQFTTDATAASYSLDSITLGINNVTTLGGTFTVNLFTDFGGQPGSSLGALSGSAPTGLGNFTFAASGITLNANTSYWVVAQATGSGNTFWATTGSASTGGSWSNSLGGSFSSNSGESWLYLNPFNNRQQFSLDATPVPEPSTYAAIAGAAMLGLAVWRRRRTKAA